MRRESVLATVLILVLTVALGLAGPAAALPVAYAYDPEGSAVTAEADYGAVVVRARLPVASASLSIDFDQGESRFTNEPSHEMTPEREFERRFALALLARVLERVRAERPGDADLLPYVGGAGDARPYAEIAAARGASEGAVKVAVHRLRARYRECLRAEIRETVAQDADVDDEIRPLLEVVGT